ncbi:MAG: hypothetical protein AAFO70_03415, partial [Pseudomonadota bacterium]
MRSMREALQRAGCTVLETGDDLRFRDRGHLRTIINYGPKEQDASHLIVKSDEILIGGGVMPVAGITVVKRA